MVIVILMSVIIAVGGMNVVSNETKKSIDFCQDNDGTYSKGKCNINGKSIYIENIEEIRKTIKEQIKEIDEKSKK